MNRGPGGGVNPADAYYLSLLGLAEFYRTRRPQPMVKECLQALTAILRVHHSSARIEARTLMQIGWVYKIYTKNVEMAKFHFEKALQLALIQTQFEDVIGETASNLAEIYLELNEVNLAKEIIWRGLERSRGHVFWQCRLLFQISELSINDGELDIACQYLTNGADLCRSTNNLYTETMFLLAKSVILLNKRQLSEANQVLVRCNQIIEKLDPQQQMQNLSNYQNIVVSQQQQHQQQQNLHNSINNNNANNFTTVFNQSIRKEILNSYFLVVQLCHCISTGRGKSGKFSLKQIQNVIQSLMKMPNHNFASQNPVEFFHWISNDVLCVLVYVLTVINYMQSGHADKALKYADKAKARLDEVIQMRTQLRSGAAAPPTGPLNSNNNPAALFLDPVASSSTFPSSPTAASIGQQQQQSAAELFDENFLLQKLRLILLESTTMCRLVAGSNVLAIKEIASFCNICTSYPRLFQSHKAQLHTLLGLYSMSMNILPTAELQFSNALRITRNIDLWTFVNLNLAVLYLNEGREQEFYGLLDRISPERLQTNSESLKAASLYVKGLQTFCQRRFPEAKRFLRDTLALADKEDMNRISSCALVLLGNLFLATSNIKDSLNMINPAMQVARSIPDLNIQIWGMGLLKDIYASCKDTLKDNECVTYQTTMNQILFNDRRQSAILPEHQLIGWTDGPLPLTFSNLNYLQSVTVDPNLTNNNVTTTSLIDF